MQIEQDLHRMDAVMESLGTEGGREVGKDILQLATTLASRIVAASALQKKAAESNAMKQLADASHTVEQRGYRLAEATAQAGLQKALKKLRKPAH